MGKNDPKNDLPDYLTPTELQQLLRVGRSAVYAAIRDGSIPSIRIGKLIRVPRAALEAK